jgi:hypothetical protein
MLKEISMQKALGIGLLASAVLLTGCESNGVVPSEPAFSNIGLTQHRQDLVLKDIPLPEDFALCPGSFCHGTDSFRYGEFQYQGQLSIDDVYFFFQKQMQAHGWQEMSMKQFETNARLAFTRHGEMCTILLREGAELTEMKIIVEQKKS